MKETLKLALVLFLFAAVGAGSLAVVNNFTSVIIAERKAQELTDSLGVVFSAADEFAPVDEAKLAEVQAANANVKNIYDAKSGGNVVGNVVEMASSGYGGAFSFILGIDQADKAVTGFKMLDHSETPGFGKKAEEPAFAEGTVGAKSGAEIEGITGATVTTGAIRTGIDGAFQAIGLMSGEVVQQSPEEMLQEALKAAYPAADSFEAKDVAGVDASVQSVHTALAGGSPIGNVVVVKAAGGYGGDITFALAVDASGAIQGFKSIEHTETPGFGAAMDEPAFAESLVGKTDANIDGISGATVTTTALKTGIEHALAAAAAAQ